MGEMEIAIAVRPDRFGLVIGHDRPVDRFALVDGAPDQGILGIRKEPRTSAELADMDDGLLARGDDPGKPVVVDGEVGLECVSADADAGKILGSHRQILF